MEMPTGREVFGQKPDRISLPSAQQTALDMALSLQAEQVVNLVLRHLYVWDARTGLWHWGKDVTKEQQQELVEAAIREVVNGEPREPDGSAVVPDSH